MAGERTHPILAVPDLAAALSFYEALGFERHMQQERPNPYAVVGLGDMRIHLAGVARMDPATSLGSVIVVVPDADGLYAQFAAGLRAAYGKLPTSGAPRLLRPRKKAGTVAGFSVVDPGGNWLRIYTAGQTEDAEASAPATLARRLEDAARLGDGKDDPGAALKIVDKALARFPDAPALERARALLYRAELAVRTGDVAAARRSVEDVTALGLGPSDAAEIAGELADLMASLQAAAD